VIITIRTDGIFAGHHDLRGFTGLNDLTAYNGQFTSKKVKYEKDDAYTNLESSMIWRAGTLPSYRGRG
jgi:hypothetical protein